MVIATQNPTEHYGTYPLPESQLDRFLMRIRIGYPDEMREKEIIRSQEFEHPLTKVIPCSGTQRSDIVSGTGEECACGRHCPVLFAAVL